MTVQELINRLQDIEDKSKNVAYLDYDYVKYSIDDVINSDNITLLH